MIRISQKTQPGSGLSNVAKTGDADVLGTNDSDPEVSLCSLSILPLSATKVREKKNSLCGFWRDDATDDSQMGCRAQTGTSGRLKGEGLDMGFESCRPDLLGQS